MYLVSGDHEIDVINTITNTLIKTIGVGASPISVAVSPDGSRFYVTNSRGPSVSVISTATDVGIAVIPAGSSPSAVSVSSDGSRLYVTDAVDLTLSVINTATNAILTTIPINGFFSDGNFVSKGSSCNGITVTFTITVNPTEPPVITADSAIGAINACAGMPSARPDIQQFTISGSNLTANITATAPAGFEISLTAGGGYSGSITIAQTGGNVSSTAVFVRSGASAAPGNISGNVTLTSGTTTQTVAVEGVINTSPTINAVANQTVKNGGATTAVNFTGTGNPFTWINDRPGIGLAGNGTGDIASFTAVNNTASAITATITVTPTPSMCIGLPMIFTIKVNPDPGKLIIPNTFTPNADGINDAWVIENLNTYPNCTVQVFNRWGQTVYSSVGYPTAWDGAYNGSSLLTGTYYYIIDLKNGSKPLSGFVAIIK